ncbi:MAG: acyl-CoA/acyl-ACP dehydrogenase [Sphingomonadaceae bacterium]|uniref:acyl-CoA dehydrogenase family protein n=1 Tax=Thermaurantiacus sp. TaxID=2820283 RepID=UPI00298F2E3D|nr:acyl-CoA dehydrogenase family protein [Thermaurantiacus sp.]MCS6986378.1 acyl-CoA/acyl-ACP dehydrogenase [Sphingomonadaceae bacterium]MDW8414360.1 acyl-CoA dehydrogenase family protein [Thermaurantiacus sp.]
MNFDLSDDAKTLRDAARRFLSAEAGPAVARRAMEAEAPYDADLWAKVVAQGWPAARVPERYGGLGLGTDEACVLAEELGRSLAPVPLLSTMAAIEALLLAGSDEQQARFLPRLASGDVVGCLAWAEGSNTPSANPATVLRDGRLFGRKAPVPDGRSAALAVVTVATPDGPAMAIAELAQASVTPVDTLDLVRRSAEIAFDGTPAEALGTPSHWTTLVERLAVLHAWEALGTAAAAMEMTLAYAKERQAFGLRIGRYQAVKHRLADMYIKAELARAHALHGCWAWGSNAPELPQAAAAARVASLDALRFAAEESVQLHGGIGFTWEHDCHLYYRRARQIAAALGSRNHWADRLVRALELRNRAAA